LSIIRKPDLSEGRMSLPVFIHQDNGHFVATLVSSPDVCVSAPTRAEALAEIQTILQTRVLHGDLRITRSDRQEVSLALV
jgi:hypothetical protein